MKKDYNITKTKLIIWDLDNTFWKGVLSEGGIEFKPEVVDFVEELTTKGIMNSICSKNNFAQTETCFASNGFKKVWQMFVFPSINWSPKGERVKNIIQSMNLREENVIFIDDNTSNINEVKFYCPKIMTAKPRQIEKMAEELYLVNDYDFQHTRLKQYKLLEEKQKDKERHEYSNEEFLRESHIKVCFKKDCKEHLERIYTLTERTNQLNFTKLRSSKEELLEIFERDECAYVIAEDKYGNYGICGFYAYDKSQNKLEHFLFSCRVMNMGIEQFVYSYLKKPLIEINGETASDLNSECSWIEIEENLEIKLPDKAPQNNINILFKGPCDLFSTLNYIDAECNIDTEFPYWNKKLIYILSHTHTAFIEQTHRLSENELEKIRQRFPFPDEDEFKTRFFDKKYNLVFLSLLTVTHSGLYINKNDGGYVVFGYSDCDITNAHNWEKLLSKIPEDAKAANLYMLKEFQKDYIFAGNPPVETVIKNLQYIRENLSDTTGLVLILGSEKDTAKVLDGYENMAERNRILNRAVREFAAEKENINIIELTELIHDDEDYTNCINHFSRRVYAELAKKVVETANKYLGKEYLRNTQ